MVLGAMVLHLHLAVVGSRIHIRHDDGDERQRHHDHGGRRSNRDGQRLHPPGMLFRNRGGLVECGSLRVHVLRIIRHTLDGGLHGTAIQGLLHALHVARELQRGIVPLLGRTGSRPDAAPRSTSAGTSGRLSLGSGLLRMTDLSRSARTLPLGIAQHIGVEILVRRLADQHGVQGGRQANRCRTVHYRTTGLGAEAPQARAHGGGEAGTRCGHSTDRRRCRNRRARA